MILDLLIIKIIDSLVISKIMKVFVMILLKKYLKKQSALSIKVVTFHKLHQIKKQNNKPFHKIYEVNIHQIT